jgi:hypothetical protein
MRWAISDLNAGDGAKLNDAEALFGRLKRQVKADYNSKGQVKWRREAREDFDFDAGEQLNEDDKAILQDAKRPIVIFNRVGTTVDSVAGEEVANRQEVQVLPRRLGVAKEKRAADVSGEVVSPAMRRWGRRGNVPGLPGDWSDQRFCFWPVKTALA